MEFTVSNMTSDIDTIVSWDFDHGLELNVSSSKVILISYSGLDRNIEFVGTKAFTEQVTNTKWVMVIKYGILCH